MGFDASLVAAASLQWQRGFDAAEASHADATHQLQLAHVLLDGGYEGVATLEEALAGGDHGLGTVDKLDGELVVVDGQPWRVNWHGVAELMPLETRTPFVIVTSMQNPVSRRVQDVSRAELIDIVDDMAEAAGGIIAVRVEGEFDSVLIRSVPPQEPPYRPYVEVCASDEVRWTKEPFAGVFVGFKFPDLAPGATIPGLHLHGLNGDRTTGGHNHDLQIRDAVITIDVTREMVMHLPDKSMADLLNTPIELREVQRSLLREGAQTAAALAAHLKISVDEAQERISWLADRGFVAMKETAAGEVWAIQLRAQTTKKSPFMSAILDAL